MYVCLDTQVTEVSFLSPWQLPQEGGLSPRLPLPMLPWKLQPQSGVLWPLHVSAVSLYIGPSSTESTGLQWDSSSCLCSGAVDHTALPQSQKPRRYCLPSIPTQGSFGVSMSMQWLHWACISHTLDMSHV